MGTFQRFTVPTGVLRKFPRVVFTYKFLKELKDMEIGTTSQMDVNMTVTHESKETDEFGNEIKMVRFRVDDAEMINKKSRKI